MGEEPASPYVLRSVALWGGSPSWPGCIPPEHGQYFALSVASAAGSAGLASALRRPSAGAAEEQRRDERCAILGKENCSQPIKASSGESLLSTIYRAFLFQAV
jgi:hypothetical protein